MSVAVGIMQLAGLASIGAGAIHAGAAGLHAENPTLARLFVAVAVAQIGVGLLALVKGGRLAAIGTALVNLGAVAAWGATRLWGISWIDGLEAAEDPEFTDTACAVLGAIAAVAAVVAFVRGRTKVSTVRLGFPAFAVGAVTLAAMLVGANHSHSHDEQEAVASGAGAPIAADGHAHGHEEEATASGAGHPSLRRSPWTGRGRSTRRCRSTSAVSRASPPSRNCGRLPSSGARCEELPAFADVESLDELGYRSIGDARTGYEHYINYSLINDDVSLDPTQPESLVFRVDGDERTLVSAMFIVGQRPIDDPELVDYGGRLMQWHVHENLCWRGGDNGPQVAGVTDADGNCPAGTVRGGGDNPMVHVWIAAHECGPFAALEGHGAGQAAAAEGTAPTSALTTTATATTARDRLRRRRRHRRRRPCRSIPSCRSTWRGRPASRRSSRRSPRTWCRQRSATCRSGPTPPTAEAAGFHSIGDAATGFEHYIQWDWIDDDVWLDPDHPESLVYRVEPDGSRTLASAMYMLPNSMTLDEVPDDGGALMQWHVHSDLCFDVSDPEVAASRRAHRLRRPVHGAADETRRVADDPRVDRAPRVRPVRRPRRRRRRPGPRRRRAPLRSRPRQHHRLTIWAASASLVDLRTPTSSQRPKTCGPASTRARCVRC